MKHGFQKFIMGFMLTILSMGHQKITFLSNFEKKVAKKSVFLDLRVITEFWKMENHDFSGFFGILEFWRSPNFHSISRPINWGGHCFFPYVRNRTYRIREKKNRTYGNPKNSVICTKIIFQIRKFASKRLRMHYNLLFRVQNTKNFRLRRAKIIFLTCK